jgi:CIC family chloride channel protein
MNNKLKENLFLIFLSSFIGVLAGIGAYLLKISIEGVHNFFWKGRGFLSLDFPFYYIILIPVIGGILVGLFKKIVRADKGHGISSVIESMFFKGGIIKKRVSIIKLISSALTIGSGGSVGKEDPVVQIGSSIGSTMGQLFKAPERKIKTLVACGAAAGLAAAFNAPMAGAMFAVEIILGDFGISGFMPIIVAAVMGTLTSHYLEGDFTAFIIPHYQFSNPIELINYFILGVLAAFVSVFFIKTLYAMEKFWDNISVPSYLKPAIGGVFIGVFGLLIPNIFGMGFKTIDLSLKNNLGIKLLILIIIFKILATSITLSSGGVGGVFVPSMYLGAIVGLLTGKIAQSVFPALGISPGAYALAGMGAGIAGATHAPITAILLIFELTKDYNVILPLMFATIVSSTISSSIFDYSIYTLGLKLKGIILKGGHEVNLLRAIKVKDVLSSDFIKFKTGDNLSKILQTAFKGKYQLFHVIDRNNIYIGSFTLTQLKDIFVKQELFDQLIVAEDIAAPFLTVKEDENLEMIMELFGKIEDDEIPVISKEGNLLGVVLRKDVIKAYNNEIKKKEITNRILSKLKFTPEKSEITIDKNYVIAEIDPPAEMVNKSLIMLELRKQYGIEVLMVKKKPPKENIPFPSADYIIEEEDTLVISGKRENIKKIRKI